MLPTISTAKAAKADAKPDAAVEILTVPSAAEARRELQRAQEFGADAKKRIWHKSEKGFCTVPRVLPLLCTLIRDLTKGADAARVYLDLWARQFEDGFVEIHDEEEIAVACGYVGGHRGVRYWRVAMGELQRLGFIEVKPKNTRKFGYVLLVHPDDVVAKVYAIKKLGASAEWLTQYDRRRLSVGAKPRSRPRESKPF